MTPDYHASWSCDPYRTAINAIIILVISSNQIGEEGLL